jgi:magnesium-transporting ATPase (P-type)
MIDPPKRSFSTYKPESSPMITGDHELTAKAIAKQLGIITSGKDYLEWNKMAALSEESVFMPVSTLNKIKNYKSTASKRPVCSYDR